MWTRDIIVGKKRIFFIWTGIIKLRKKHFTGWTGQGNKQKCYVGIIESVLKTQDFCHFNYLL